MTTPGFFELYPSARPALPADSYTATSAQQLVAATPHDGDQTIPVDDTTFHLTIDAPRYLMPPDQILSTFPPATSQGDWRERFPQIVLKRRTLPWERNPTNPATDPAQAPPWLALVVLAEGEGQLSSDVDVSQCVSPGVSLGPAADVPRGKYLEVTKAVVDAVFPCRDELDLLCHVRKVDLSDTELALGDDDGFMAVVLSSRLPQPAPPADGQDEPRPLKYTAYLINLEHQLDTLRPTEPNSEPSFEIGAATRFIDPELLVPPHGGLDEIAMGTDVGTGFAPMGLIADTHAPEHVSYEAARGLETQSAAWVTGPARGGVQRAGDLSVAADWKLGLIDGAHVLTGPRFRYPVLASWDFTSTGSGGFERLMNELDIGLLGTLDPDARPPVPEVAATGHVGLGHRTRRGEPARSWYRGPLTPQPTERGMPVGGVLPLAHTGDQLRRVVPDGREDVSLAALFEIGRLLTLNKPTLVAQLMQWRRELFGAARARDLADRLAAGLVAGIGLSAIAGRESLEDLIREHVVGAYVTAAPEKIGPHVLEATAARVPDALAKLTAAHVIGGLGGDLETVTAAGKRFGADGLASVPVAAAPARDGPLSADEAARAALGARLSTRLEALTDSVLGRSSSDALDRLIDDATKQRGG